MDPSETKKPSKAGEESEGADSSQAELDAESDDVRELEELPSRTKQLYWAQKAKSRKYDDQFDELYCLDDQFKEYNEIKNKFENMNKELERSNKKPISINMDSFKKAIFLQPGL